MSEKTAIILFNLGGPDSFSSVEPFLFNLFNDKAIIRLSRPFRGWLAKLISSRRAPIAREIYAQIGGRSPILELTQAQAAKLEDRLNETSLRGGGADAASQPELLRSASNDRFKVFTSMRYWHPFSDEVAAQVKDYAPDRIVLLPLYPQYSTTTTGSSLKDWQRAAKKAGLSQLPSEAICCYPTHPHFIASHAAQLLKTYEEAQMKGSPRILFSAHGLPEKIIRDGDPYQWQVEQTVAAIMEVAFGHDKDWTSAARTSDQAGAQPQACFARDSKKSADIGGRQDAQHLNAVNYTICYQSRVGPMKWIGPSTEAEIIAAAEEGLPIVVVPVAFVSEHSETLVELDIEYRHLAEKHGSSNYFRVPALGVDDWFIDALADLVQPVPGPAQGSGKSLANDSQIRYPHIRSHCGARICPTDFRRCPMKLH